MMVMITREGEEKEREKMAEGGETGSGELFQLAQNALKFTW